ncbi:MAG: glycoside hydrolase family 2 [Clostridiales bacterium]|nr:glycoside hydrolase family 2 [Clostridiales bacterium]
MRKLMTSAGEALSGVPWNAYPRPQMVRKDWLCLNGTWSFIHGDTRAEIRVPFCPESLLSGLGLKMEYGREMVYSRSFTLPEEWRGKRILLHFGAVSRSALVRVNGREAVSHEESYLPFSADVTSLLREGENEISVTAVNDLSHRHPWGKQKENRGGMWYTPVSGIWQTVWLEPVPEKYISSLAIRAGRDWAEITAEGVDSGVVELGGESYPLSGGAVRICVPDPILWSPESPHLYRFSVTSGKDRVESYFALRTLSVERAGGKPRLCLNGEPYFFHGLLDQGYWSDGLYTPAAPSGYEEDIRAMKALGFNMLRKHIKIEPEQFYYDCDRLGMVVFQDMVNCGEYRFLRDTILPTLGLHPRSDARLNRDPAARENFLSAMDATVRLLGNHPCICLWTIFNEGWGQFRADDAYRRLKALDPGRFIDSTSGWFAQRESDVESLHIYFRRLKAGKQDRPLFLSEFGGWSLKFPEHSFNLEKTYGYKKYEDRDIFVRDLMSLYLDQVLPLVAQGLCAAVYTQVSDVEDETNGLLTFDRKAAKVTPEEFRDVSERLCRAVREQA